MQRTARLLISLVTAGAAAGCTEREQPTEIGDAVLLATVSAVERTPLSQAVANPCNGDVVATEGELQLVFGAHADQAGGDHIQAHINEHGAGTGLAAGDKYSFSADTSFVANTPDPTSETTQVVNVHLVGQGGVPNFFAHQVLHFTVNANGQVTAIVDQLQSECH